MLLQWYHRLIPKSNRELSSEPIFICKASNETPECPRVFPGHILSCPTPVYVLHHLRPSVLSDGPPLTPLVSIERQNWSNWAKIASCSGHDEGDQEAYVHKTVFVGTQRLRLLVQLRVSTTDLNKIVLWTG